MVNDIQSKKLFIFDIDGTISLGNTLFEKTTVVFEKLYSQGKHIYLITNNSSKTPAHYISNLDKKGIDTSKIKLISSLDIAIDYLLENAMKNIFWSANTEVSAYIEERGLCFDDTSPDAMLVTFDTELNYNKLLKITELIHKKVPYFVTHTDFVCPTDLGYPIPDVGSFMELIRKSTGKLPDKSFGKPEVFGIEKAMKDTGLNINDVIVFGDRLYTDIELAVKAGVTGVLVLSGETTMQMYNDSHIRANIVLESINQLCDLL